MESLRIAVSDLKDKIQGLLEELKADPRFSEINKSIAALHSLEDVLGEDRSEIHGLWNSSTTSSIPAPERGAAQFRNDEFYGLESLEAAKRVLRKIGKSTRLADIIAGIKAGGGDPGNEDKLRVSLARSTVEVAKIGDDLFGLVEFYPHLKRGTPGRRKKNGANKDELGGDEVSVETESPESGGTLPGEELKGDS